jgi:hypothetical protein
VFDLNYFNLTPNNEKKCLISLFVLFTLIKSALSLFFTPVQWSDEYVWYSVAHDIFASGFTELFRPVQLYPIGYPALLSLANFFSGEKEIVYHCMLVINSILTSSIIVPSYYLLKKYTSLLQAFLGSILIAVLPTVMLYNFILMTENLFIPLVLFSIWTLHEAFERRSVAWDVLAAIVILLLYLTRDTTGVVFIGAFVLTQFFFCLTTDRATLFREMKNKGLILIAIAIPLCIFIAYRIFYSGTRTYFDYSQFANGFFSTFLDINSIFGFFFLVFCHIDYIIISSYFLIFIISVLLISECLLKRDIYGFYTDITRYFSDTFTTLRAVIFYCTIFSAGLLVVNTIYVRTDAELIMHYGSVQGRYIYPVIPVLFLFGLIALSLLARRSGADRQDYWKLIVVSIPLLCLSIPLLPHISPTIVNNYSLVYVSTLVSSLHPAVVFILLGILFFVIPWYLLKETGRLGKPSKILAYFIILTVILSIPTYGLQMDKVRSEKNVYQNAKWLEQHTTADTVTLLANDNYYSIYDGYIELFRDKFWAPGNVSLIYKSYFTHDDIRFADYIIVKRWLPYKCVSISNSPDGYRIYAIHTNISPYEWGSPIQFGRDGSSRQYQVSGWSFPEDGFTWTSGGESTIRIPVENVPESVSFTIQGRAFTGPGLSGQRAFLTINNNTLAEPILMNGSISRVSIPVPAGYVKNGDNELSLRLPDATSPKNLGMSPDDRLLGLGVFNITLSSNQ